MNLYAKGEFDMKKIKLISILLLILSLFCTLDLSFVQKNR